MNNMKRKNVLNTLSISILFFILLSFSVSLSAQEQLAKIKQKGELRVGLTDTQPPYAMQSKDSTIIGFEADIAQIIADRMGVKLVMVPLNFSELLSSLKEGEIDLIMSGMTMSTERNMEVAFIGPYHNAGKSILTFAQVYADAESPDELNKGSVKIAALKGSTSEEFIVNNMPKAKLISTNDYEEAIDLLNNDKVGLVVAEKSIIRFTMMQYPESGYVTLDDPFNYEPIGMGVMPNDVLLINLLQNIISELIESGEINEIENSWFWDDEWIEKVN